MLTQTPSRCRSKPVSKPVGPPITSSSSVVEYRPLLGNETLMLRHTSNDDHISHFDFTVCFRHVVIFDQDPLSVRPLEASDLEVKGNKSSNWMKSHKFKSFMGFGFLISHIEDRDIPLLAASNPHLQGFISSAAPYQVPPTPPAFHNYHIQPQTSKSSGEVILVKKISQMHRLLATHPRRRTSPDKEGSIGPTGITWKMVGREVKTWLCMF